MLWACLHFSDLPLRAVFDDSEQTLPCGVVDGPLQRQHIVFVNAPASRGGVRAGRVLAAARAVCAALQARRRDRTNGCSFTIVRVVVDDHNTGGDIDAV